MADFEDCPKCDWQQGASGIEKWMCPVCADKLKKLYSRSRRVIGILEALSKTTVFPYTTQQDINHFISAVEDCEESQCI